MPFAMPYRIVVDDPQTDLVMGSAYTLGYAKLLLAKLSAELQTTTALAVVDRQGNNILPFMTGDFTPRILFSDADNPF